MRGKTRDAEVEASRAEARAVSSSPLAGGTTLAMYAFVSNVGGQVTTLGTELSDPAAVWSPPSPRRRAADARLAGSFWGRIQLAVVLYRAFFAFGVWLGRVGVSANALTYASLAFAAAACVAAGAGAFALAALAVVIGGVCDALDGIVARSTGTVSRYGALLDSTVDRVTDALPLLGVLVFYAEAPTFAIVPGLALLGALVIPYVRARTEALGASLPSLFMRRPERLVLLIICLLLGEVEVAAQLAVPLLLIGTLILAVLNTFGGVLVLRAARVALDASELDASEFERAPGPQSALRRP